MKKKLCTILVAAVFLSACGTTTATVEEPSFQQTVQEEQSVEESESEEESKSEEVVVESEAESAAEVFGLPLGTDCGQGTMHLATAGGTSEDGNVPKILVEDDTILFQIGINTSGFDRTLFSYIFIDGMLVNIAQYGDSQGTITLENEYLSEGEHIVSVVQYEGDDSANEIITYKEAKYLIVLK